MFLTAEELAKRTETGRAQMPAQLFDDLGGGKPGHTTMVYNGRTPAERCAPCLPAPVLPAAKMGLTDACLLAATSWFCERLVLTSIGPAAEVTEDILRSATHAGITALRQCSGVDVAVVRPPVLETTWDPEEGVSIPSGCDIPFSRCVGTPTTRWA